MPIIENMSIALLWLIRVGVVLRIVFMYLQLMFDDSKEDAFKNRRRNILIFYLIAESIYQIAAIVKMYFFGTPSRDNIEVSQFIINLLM